MSAASRLLGACAPLQLDASSSSPSNTASGNAWRCRPWWSSSSSSAKMKELYGNGRGSKRQVAAAARGVADSVSSVFEGRRKGEKKGVVDLALLVMGVGRVADGLGRTLRPAGMKKAWRVQVVEMLVEKAVINCRFFALFALFGSLLGSILCFIEGCVLVVESFLEFFHTMAQRSNQVEVIQLLIEALDSFLIGTAMLTFGLGMYSLFVSSKQENGDKRWLIPESNFFGLFPLKWIPPWIEMQCVSQAKSKIGHGVVILLLAGLVEKLKNVPVANGFDLACFAGAILVSSASISLLSRLSIK